MKIDKRQIFLTLLVYVLTAIFMPLVFAESGDADAGRKPLNFLSATYNGINLKGAASVPLTPKITMAFDKNIVNADVWNINKNCFSLYSDKNEKVQINVTKIDDTVDFNQRQNVFIEPVQPLKPGTSYTLKVSGDLKAKNGNSTLAGTTGGAGVSITFKTVGQAPTTGQTGNQGSGDSTSTGSATTGSTSSGSTTTGSTSTDSTSTDSSVNNPTDTGSASSDSTASDSSEKKSNRFSLTKATSMLTRVVGLLQAVLFLGNSLDQFHSPL